MGDFALTAVSQNAKANEKAKVKEFNPNSEESKTKARKKVEVYAKVFEEVVVEKYFDKALSFSIKEFKSADTNHNGELAPEELAAGIEKFEKRARKMGMAEEKINAQKELMQSGMHIYIDESNNNFKKIMPTKFDAYAANVYAGLIEDLPESILKPKAEELVPKFNPNSKEAKAEAKEFVEVRAELFGEAVNKKSFNKALRFSIKEFELANTDLDPELTPEEVTAGIKKFEEHAEKTGMSREKINAQKKLMMSGLSTGDMDPSSINYKKPVNTEFAPYVTKIYSQIKPAEKEAKQAKEPKQPKKDYVVAWDMVTHSKVLVPKHQKAYPYKTIEGHMKNGKWVPPKTVHKNVLDYIFPSKSEKMRNGIILK